MYSNDDDYQAPYYYNDITIPKDKPSPPSKTDRRNSGKRQAKKPRRRPEHGASPPLPPLPPPAPAAPTESRLEDDYSHGFNKVSQHRNDDEHGDHDDDSDQYNSQEGPATDEYDSTSSGDSGDNVPEQSGYISSKPRHDDDDDDERPVYRQSSASTSFRSPKESSSRFRPQHDRLPAQRHQRKSVSDNWKTVSRQEQSREDNSASKKRRPQLKMKKVHD